MLVPFPDKSSSNVNPVPKKEKNIFRLEETYMSSSSGAFPAFLNTQSHCSQNFAWCWCLEGFPNSPVWIIAANSGPLWPREEFLALGVSVGAALVKQASRLLLHGKQDELWEMALLAELGAVLWVRVKREGIMSMPDHQLFPVCWSALEKSLEVELGKWNT